MTGYPTPTFDSATLNAPLPVASGGTGAATAAAALTALGAASRGANSNITSLSGLTTALSVAQGGTGSTTLGGGLAYLGTSYSASNSTTGTTISASFTFTPSVGGVVFVNYHGTSSGFSTRIFTASGGTVVTEQAAFGDQMIGAAIVRVTAGTSCTITCGGTQSSSAYIQVVCVGVMIPGNG